MYDELVIYTPADSPTPGLAYVDASFGARFVLSLGSPGEAYFAAACPNCGLPLFRLNSRRHGEDKCNQCQSKLPLESMMILVMFKYLDAPETDGEVEEYLARVVGDPLDAIIVTNLLLDDLHALKAGMNFALRHASKQKRMLPHDERSALKSNLLLQEGLRIWLSNPNSRKSQRIVLGDRLYRDLYPNSELLKTVDDLR